MNTTANRMVAQRRIIEGTRKSALETGRSRLLLTGMILAVAFASVAGRLVDLTVMGSGFEPTVADVAPNSGPTVGRANIVDRNGIILAVSLPTVSLSADPARIIDTGEAAAKLVSVLTDMSDDEVLSKLKSKGRFVWLARNLTPKQHQDIIRLGIPGLSFHRGEKRVYPHGRLISHVIGLTDVDGLGTAGVENHFDETLRTGGRPLRLSLDLRIQSILRDELIAAKRTFKAIGAAGLVLDVNTGEVVAMVSLPDFDPNLPADMSGDAAFNRAAKGVYEMGSTFKLFTAAMALDSGTVSLKGGYDASKPIRIGRFTISDYHAKNRWLSVPEIILHSSNIGAAKMAVDVGTATQRDYLGRFGLLQPAALELPEVGSPLMPGIWRPINTMTISFGHGISVSPVQLAAGIATLVNGGVRRAPTLIKNGRGLESGERAITRATSEKMRGLMRLVVSRGTGRKADVRGYLVGGKTGTAEKISRHGYSKSAKISSFVGVFPMHAPEYVVLTLLDEPVGNKKTFNYATGGWVAAPVVGRVIERMGPMVGIVPEPDLVVATPKIPVAKSRPRVAGAHGASKPKRKHQAERWSASIRSAIGASAAQQTSREERVLLEARQALKRAVAATEAQKPVITTVHSALERKVAAR